MAMSDSSGKQPMTKINILHFRKSQGEQRGNDENKEGPNLDYLLVAAWSQQCGAVACW